MLCRWPRSTFTTITIIVIVIVIIIIIIIGFLIFLILSRGSVFWFFFFFSSSFGAVENTRFRPKSQTSPSILFALRFAATWSPLIALGDGRSHDTFVFSSTSPPLPFTPPCAWCLRVPPPAKVASGRGRRGEFNSVAGRGGLGAGRGSCRRLSPPPAHPPRGTGGRRRPREPPGGEVAARSGGSLRRQRRAGWS